MKKVFVIALAAILLTGCASKSEDANKKNGEADLVQMKETLASAQEVYVPEQDTNVVGSVSYYPNTGAASSAIAGSNCVSLFCQNNYVKANEGTISLFERDTQRKVASIRAEDDTHVVIDEITKMGMEYTGFKSGTQIDLYFDYPFEAGKTYFVLMDSECFKLGRIFSKAVTDAEVIVFRTKDYGFSGDWRSIYHRDEFAFFDIVLGKMADRAEVKSDPAYVSVANPVITRDDIEAEDDPNGYRSKPLITFLQEGTPTITVLFYRGDEVVDSVQAGFEVVVPEVEIEDVEIVNHAKEKKKQEEAQEPAGEAEEVEGGEEALEEDTPAEEDDNTENPEG